MSSLHVMVPIRYTLRVLLMHEVLFLNTSTEKKSILGVFCVETDVTLNQS